MVKRSFQSCGISNALDGTEDDAMYTDEMPELADSEDEMEDEDREQGGGEWRVIKASLKQNNTKQLL